MIQTLTLLTVILGMGVVAALITNCGLDKGASQ